MLDASVVLKWLLEDPAREPDMAFATTDDPNVMRRATNLAIETNHHLFDTLYHAVALENEDASLVTADDRYHRRAERYGMIAALSNWGSAP